MTVTTTWTSPAEGGSLDRDSGQTIREQDWDGVLSNLNHIGGSTGVAAQSFTPTLTQSASVTASTAAGRYFRLGSWVFYTVRLVASSSGTAGNAIVIGGLPVAAADTSVAAAPGWANFTRSSNPVYPLAAHWNTSTSVRFFANAGTNVFGINPAVTLASGDEMNVTGFYLGA